MVFNRDFLCFVWTHPLKSDVRSLLEDAGKRFDILRWGFPGEIIFVSLLLSHFFPPPIIKCRTFAINLEHDGGLWHYQRNRIRHLAMKPIRFMPWRSTVQTLGRLDKEDWYCMRNQLKLAWRRETLNRTLFKIIIEHVFGLKQPLGWMEVEKYNTASH